MNKIIIKNHHHHHPHYIEQQQQEQEPQQLQPVLLQPQPNNSTRTSSTTMPAGSTLQQQQVNNDTGLYFKIVCDPGHERTARELRSLSKDKRERVWADMTGDPSTTHYHVNPEDPTFVRERILELRHAIRVTIAKEEEEQQQRDQGSTSSNPNDNNNNSQSFYAAAAAARRIGSSSATNSDTSSGGLNEVSANPSAFALVQAYRQSPTLFFPTTEQEEGEEDYNISFTTTTTTSVSSLSSSSESYDFYLLFLRAEEFHIESSCQRMIRYFANKYDLFGPTKLELLTRTIRLDDLSIADKESLGSGAIQILPRRDRAGRLVIISRYRNFIYQEKKNLLRAIWYLFNSTVLGDPIVQKLGIIVVGYELGNFVPVDHELTRLLFRVVRSIPIRVVACHSCFSDSPTQKVVDLVVHMVSNFVRLRLRCHRGSPQEVKYRLVTMGIPADTIPVTDDGQLLLETHNAWLQYRIHEEAAIVEVEDETENGGSTSGMQHEIEMNEDTEYSYEEEENNDGDDDGEDDIMMVEY